MEACHELLVRLAGGLPDRLLWRLRDWLASGAHSAVAALLPRALLRNRVGLTDEERDLLETAVAGHAPRKLLDAVLTLTTADEPDVTFRPAPTADTTALCLLAVARGESGCTGVQAGAARQRAPRAAGGAGARRRTPSVGVGRHAGPAAARTRRPRAVRRGAARRRSPRLPPGRTGRLDPALAPPRGADRRSLTGCSTT